jgi:hypothetical protein
MKPLVPSPPWQTLWVATERLLRQSLYYRNIALARVVDERPEQD